MDRPGNAVAPNHRQEAGAGPEPPLRLTLTVEPAVQAAVDPAWLSRIALTTAAVTGFDDEAEVALMLAGDETLRRLNRTYRGLDQPTDVLSFGQMEPSAAPFVSPPDTTLHLGDIIISYPRAVAQAAVCGHSRERELAYLLVHGLLHLLGYDHADERDYAHMRNAEERILERLGLGRPEGREEPPE